ncbi:protein LKAAEAR1 [Ambystoma mexicanum]|uniref:protein LKAAEAR1 n=1 Tax=Ambystoma mexicanum TaxID=8296 RepID=UPI0037E81AEA
MAASLRGKDASSKEVDVKKMTPVQRARHMAYELPSKEVEMSVLSTRNRLKTGARALHAATKPHQDAEQTRQAKVVGQLKAAEARNRVRIMRLRYQTMKTQEINHLIASQPTARDALRLQVFIPPRQEVQFPPDPLDHVEASSDRFTFLESHHLESHQ